MSHTLQMALLFCLFLKLDGRKVKFLRRSLFCSLADFVLEMLLSKQIRWFLPETVLTRALLSDFHGPFCHLCLCGSIMIWSHLIGFYPRGIKIAAKDPWSQTRDKLCGRDMLEDPSFQSVTACIQNSVLIHGPFTLRVQAHWVFDNLGNSSSWRIGKRVFLNAFLNSSVPFIKR